MLIIAWQQEALIHMMVCSTPNLVSTTDMVLNYRVIVCVTYSHITRGY